MFGNFMLKQLLRSKLGDIPEAERERLLVLIEKNPDIFKAIATEAAEHMKAGKDQMSALREAVHTHESELRNLTP